METDYSNHATNDEIRQRFDKDVERFSNLETGQQTTIDAPLTMDLCRLPDYASSKIEDQNIILFYNVSF